MQFYILNFYIDVKKWQQWGMSWPFNWGALKQYHLDLLLRLPSESPLESLYKEDCWQLYCHNLALNFVVIIIVHYTQSYLTVCVSWSPGSPAGDLCSNDDNIDWLIIWMTKMMTVMMLMLVAMMMRVILMVLNANDNVGVLRTCVWQVWAWKRGLAERGLLPLSAHPLKQSEIWHMIRSEI